MENAKRKTYTGNFRVETNYYSTDYDDRMCETSTPFNSLDDAYNAYQAAKLEKCIDDPEKAVRVDLVVYMWEADENGNATGKAEHHVFMSNYRNIA